jgi:hypothetical protein
LFDTDHAPLAAGSALPALRLRGPAGLLRLR